MPGTKHAFDISGPLDEGRWSGYRKSVAVMMALAIVFDGLDNQLLGLAVPSIAAEFHVAKPDFAHVFAAGTIGMAVGGFSAGLIGDRVGRRLAALLTILIFAAATAAMALPGDLQGLMILRFLAGIGLGGLIPNAVALVAEFTPARTRSGAVMTAMACVPVGGFVAALLVSSQMDALGWRALFVIAGGGALLFAALLWFVLPESPRYLIQRPERSDRLVSLLRKMSIDPGTSTEFVDRHEKPGKVKIGVLFQQPYRRDTLALCGAALFAHVSSYSFISWLPATLSQLGLSSGQQGLATAIFNVGGIIGIPIGAVAVTRIGSRVPLLTLNAVGVLGAILMMEAQAIADFGLWPLMLFLALLAAALGVVQTGMLSLAVHVFPTQVRTTGTGMMGAVSRIGALASSFTAAIALQQGGARFFFLSVALVMAICGICLFLIRQHIPRIRKDPLVEDAAQTLPC